MRNLSAYTLKPDSEAFILQLEDDTGRSIEFMVSAEQLDALVEAADELLDSDDGDFDGPLDD